MNTTQKTGLVALTAVMVLTLGITPAFASHVTHNLSVTVSTGVCTDDRSTVSNFDSTLEACDNPNVTTVDFYTAGQGPCNVQITYKVNGQTERSAFYSNAVIGTDTFNFAISNGDVVTAKVVYSVCG